MNEIAYFVIMLTLTVGVLLASTSAGLLTVFAQSNQTRATSSSSVAASLSGSPARMSKVKITSPIRDQQLPVGKDLTVSGTSIDNATSNDCKVSVIVNKVRPYQNTTAAGAGGAADYSKWNFVLTSKYTTIKPGENRITAKYECANNAALTSFSSVNVTGVPSASATNATNPTNSTTTGASTITNLSTTAATKPNATTIAHEHTTTTGGATTQQQQHLVTTNSNNLASASNNA